MPAGVNLVPSDCLLRQQALRRRTFWLRLLVGAYAALGCGWIVRVQVGRADSELRQTIARARDAGYVVEQQLSAANKERDELLSRLDVLTGLRQPQPWPAHLARLYRATPDGIVLRSLRVEQQEKPAPAPPPPGGGTAATAATVAPKPPEPVPDAYIVHIDGHAAEHGLLTGLIVLLRHEPGWESVDLLQADSGDLAGQPGVTFSLRARVVEGG